VQSEYKALEEWIKLRILPNTEEGIEYWCRQGEFEEWENKRRLNVWSVTIGDPVDFWTSKGWKTAIMKELFVSSSQELMAKVSIRLNSKLLATVELPSSSRKLAPHGFFT
jgi:hypothetical protein